MPKSIILKAQIPKMMAKRIQLLLSERGIETRIQSDYGITNSFPVDLAVRVKDYKKANNLVKAHFS